VGDLIGFHVVSKELPWDHGHHARAITTAHKLLRQRNKEISTHKSRQTNIAKSPVIITTAGTAVLHASQSNGCLQNVAKFHVKLRDQVLLKLVHEVKFVPGSSLK
jgi:hypothetical protein